MIAVLFAQIKPDFSEYQQYPNEVDKYTLGVTYSDIILSTHCQAWSDEESFELIHQREMSSKQILVFEGVYHTCLPSSIPVHSRNQQGAELFWAEEVNSFFQLNFRNNPGKQ
jgi:hypothetical protein